MSPAHTALLVIDMQRDFLDPSGYAARAGLDIEALRRPIPAIQKLLISARRLGMLAVHTREGHRSDLSDCPPVKLERSRAAGAEIGSRGPLGRLLVRGEFGHDFADDVDAFRFKLLEVGQVAFHKCLYCDCVGAHGVRPFWFSCRFVRGACHAPLHHLRCSPHSLCSGFSHHHLPLLGCSPGATGLVQGAQPMDG